TKLTGHKNVVRGLAFLSDHRLVSAAFENGMKIWDLGTGKESQTIPVPGSVAQLQCSADGLAAVVFQAGLDQPRVWGLGTASESARKLPAIAEAKMSLATDGNTLALGGQGREVLLWDIQKGSAGKTLVVDKHVYLLCYSADGKTLAAADYSAVRVWDVPAGKLRGVLRGACLRLAPSGGRGPPCTHQQPRHP